MNYQYLNEPGCGVMDTGAIFWQGNALPHSSAGAGYETVSIQGRRYYVHVLVARAFLGEPSKVGLEPNHKNGNKQDNRADNLEWLTHKENSWHAARAGLLRPGGRPIHILTEEIVTGVRAFPGSGDAAARHFGISSASASRIRRGLRWA